MNRFIYSEAKKIFFPCLLVTVAFILYSCIYTVATRDSYIYFRNIEMWEKSMEVIVFLYALIAVAPVCWIVYYERKDNYIIYTLPRISKKNYLLSKWFITFTAGALILFFISLISLLIILFFFKQVSFPSSYNDHALTTHYAGYIFVNHSFIYGLLLSIWRALIGGLIATMGFILSLYVKNIFIILSAPFVFTLLDSFILANLRVPQYGLFTVCEPHALVAKAISPLSFLIGAGSLVLTNIVLLVYFKLNRKEVIYHI